MDLNNKEFDLSIIVVSFNTIEMTQACLASIFNNIGSFQTQVIVVDNNSQDGSRAMIRDSFKDVELIENSDNKGFAAANNQGFKVACGRFVLLLNSDTVILGSVLERSLLYLLDHPKVGAMGCRVLNTDGTVQATCSGYPTLLRLFNFTIGLDRVFGSLDRYLLRSWRRDDERDVEVISGCYLLLRREVLEQIGELDENFFFFGEETDWCLRMRRAGWNLKFAPVGEIIHHGGGSVKKLNFKRDVMLTEALVKLHRKNEGIFSAIIVFAVLFSFNLSRALYWTVRSLLSKKFKGRAEHFQQVVLGTLSICRKG